MKGTCQCGELVEMRADGNRLVFVSHACAKRPLTTTKGEGSVTGVVPPSGRPAPTAPVPTFSNAKRTACGAGHVHASKLEARVCDRLTAEYAADKLHRLVQQVRLPLLALAEWDGRLRYITVDFGVIHKSEEYPGLVRLVEAKNPKRISRDWPARKRACELSWGVTIEEVDR